MTTWRRILAAASALFSGESAGLDDVGGGGDARSRDADVERDVDFTIAVIGLGAKLAKADGKVTSDETAAFFHVFRLPESARRDVERVFGLAQKTTLGFESYARRLARRWGERREVLEDVLDGLFFMASADGEISAPEVVFLQEVATIFGLAPGEFRRLTARWKGFEDDDPYCILGVDPDVDDAALRRAYRAAAGAHHPDKACARGLPSACERLANAKMAAINAAYDQIRAERAGQRRRGD